MLATSDALGQRHRPTLESAHAGRPQGEGPYVIRTGHRAGQTCGKFHTQHRCFSHLDDAWRAVFGDEAERPSWLELLRSGADIFALDYDAILAAMYALTVSAEGDYYLCVPPDPGIEVAALGASESALPGTAPAEALHTFTLDSGASRCFFRDSTILTPLPAPVPVSLADPSGGPVLRRSSTVLPCPALPSGSLSGLHLPSFSTNLVSTAALQDAMVTTTTPGGQSVSICTCTRTGRHLATFTRWPGSSLYSLTTEPPQVAVSAQESALGPVEAPCSCRLLSHQTLLWHHRLGHPSLPRLRGMHSRLLVSGLPRSLPPLPPSPAPPCLPCVEGRQRPTPHSSSFPSTTAPLHTLHMDVWGPARRSKGEVPNVLIPWIRAVRLQLRERFRTDLPVLHLHSDRGGDFSSDLLREFCRREGILHSFILPASPQQNGVAERRIGLVMEVASQSLAPCLLVGDLAYTALDGEDWRCVVVSNLGLSFTTPPRAVSSSFPSTTAPLQTLHMDVWGPARVSGQGRERYFLLVVDDYTRYTTVFPLCSKGEVVDVLIPWIRAVRLQLRERFHQDLLVLRLHSDRGGEFSSDLLREFCRGEGILQSFMLPDSPQQNGVAERFIGLVMEVARTSMIHAAAPYFLWPFAVRYAAHQLNLWPRVPLPETSLTLRWTGEVGDASVFQVWGSRAFVRDMSADKLSARAIPCVFLGFPPDAPGWQLYHPTSRRVSPSQDVTFDKSVPFYRLFPYRSGPLPPPPLFLAPGPPPVDPLPPQGPSPSSVSQGDPRPGTVPVEVTVDSSAARGIASPGAEPGA
ncbi:unnamed protein product [Closterium sp. NIES-53]